MSVPDSIIDVHRVDVRAGDVLVVRVPAHTAAAQFEWINEAVRENFNPSIKVLVISADVELEVVRPET